MHLHVGEFEDDLADTIRITVVLLVRAAQDHLVQELTHKLVTLLETVVSTLRTVISDPLLALSTQCLIALQAVVGICHQVKAHRARKGLLKELITLEICSTAIEATCLRRGLAEERLAPRGSCATSHFEVMVVHLVTKILLHDERLISQVSWPVKHATRIND